MDIDLTHLHGLRGCIDVVYGSDLRDPACSCGHHADRERTPLLALGECGGVLIPMVYRCGHVIVEVVSRVGRIRLF